jgi:hypothetical protein
LEVIEFNNKKADDGPERQQYTIEIMNPKTYEIVGSESVYGFLSLGGSFVAIVEDNNKPIIMLPYERVASIKVIKPQSFDA